MSDLTTTRDHCRRMATAVHTDDCHTTTPMRWGGTITNRPDPACTGCVPESDRALFAQLAGEIDAYLAGDPDVITPPTVDDVPLEGL